jgi:L-threonylcarbamoyladenylate synthase
MLLDARTPAGLDAALAPAAACLRAGGLIGLPTETVYGLGGDAENPAAVAAIFAAKGRPADHPLIVHVADGEPGIKALAHLASFVPPFAQALARAFWPGPLTLILPRREGVAQAAAGGQDSIGLRCPAHPVALALLRLLAQGPQPLWGIAAPSANRFGRVSPTSAAHVRSELGESFMVLDGGDCQRGIESTIVDCTRGQPVLLRPGPISRAQLRTACGQRVLLPAEATALRLQQAAPRASGTLASHYAPRARVVLMDTTALETALQNSVLPSRLGLYLRSAHVQSLATRLPQPMLARMPRSAPAAARSLFATLRRLDDAGVDAIWVEAVPDGIAWDGVRDRLQRAAA